MPKSRSKNERSNSIELKTFVTQVQHNFTVYIYSNLDRRGNSTRGSARESTRESTNSLAEGIESF